MQYGHASATGHGASATGRAAAAGRWLAWMLALALVLFARPAAALTEDDFLPPEQAFVFSAAMTWPVHSEARSFLKGKGSKALFYPKYSSSTISEETEGLNIKSSV